MPKHLLNLIKGYQAFRQQYFAGNASLSADNQKYAELVAHGQNPQAIVIACSDARVDPAIVLNCKPGELFVIRNVANLVPPYEEDCNTYHGTSAALEFGICSLNIPDVIVLGHSRCGGIQALIEDPEFIYHTGFLGKWMQIASPALNSYRNDQQYVLAKDHANIYTHIQFCAKQALIHSLHNLMTFPWIESRVIKSKLNLHAWFFNLETGIIEAWNEEKQLYENL